MSPFFRRNVAKYATRVSNEGYKHGKLGGPSERGMVGKVMGRIYCPRTCVMTTDDVRNMMNELEKKKKNIQHTVVRGY